MKHTRSMTMTPKKAQEYTMWEQFLIVLTKGEAAKYF